MFYFRSNSKSWCLYSRYKNKWYSRRFKPFNWDNTGNICICWYTKWYWRDSTVFIRVTFNSSWEWVLSKGLHQTGWTFRQRCELIWFNFYDFVYICKLLIFNFSSSSHYVVHVLLQLRLVYMVRLIHCTTNHRSIWHHCWHLAINPVLIL
jgi:hypothetical protein